MMRHALVLFLLFCVALAEILQVQVIHRHGAREHLSKNASNPGQENGAALLPAGAEQLRTLGKLLRDRYLRNGSMHQVRNSRSNFSSALDTFSVSSNLDRTLSSARSLLQGLYPADASIIPTKVFSAKENDFRLRGYTICPKFASQVREFTTSIAFRVREKKYKAFIERIARAVNEEPSLANIFNIFDRYKLLRLGYVAGGHPMLPKADWVRLQSLANWVESEKFRKTGGLVAGGMVGAMLRYADIATKSVNSLATHRIITYSAHYPTLLGIFAALRIAPTPTFPANGIPEFGAALIWELHTGSRLRMLWYDGNKTLLHPLPLLIPSCTDAAGGCPLDVVTSALSKRKRIYYEAGPFCEACRTDPGTTHVCTAGARPGNVSDITSSAQTRNGRRSCGTRQGRITAAFLGAFLGIALGVLFSICVGRISARRKRRRMLRIQRHMQEIDERAIRPLEEIAELEVPKTVTADIYSQHESGNGR